jgi:hypothetical protein
LHDWGHRPARALERQHWHAPAPKLNAVHFNADEVRGEINADPGFSELKKIEHALRALEGSFTFKAGIYINRI